MIGHISESRDLQDTGCVWMDFWWLTIAGFFADGWCLDGEGGCFRMILGAATPPPGGFTSPPPPQFGQLVRVREKREGMRFHKWIIFPKVMTFTTPVACGWGEGFTSQCPSAPPPIPRVRVRAAAQGGGPKSGAVGRVEGVAPGDGPSAAEQQIGRGLAPRVPNAAMPYDLTQSHTISHNHTASLNIA